MCRFNAHFTIFSFACSQILHHSIDYLIGLMQHKSIIKLSHKLGFSNPDEFENALKCISSIYRQYSLEMIQQSELLTHFAHFNTDFQQSVLDVYAMRRIEVEEFLITEHNARKNELLMSFDWDVRQILGTSNAVGHRSHIASLILNLKGHESLGQRTIHMEMTRQRVDEFIDCLEKLSEQMSSVEASQ